MTTLEHITQHAARLPEALQIEVLHFAMFLDQKQSTAINPSIETAESEEAIAHRRDVLAKALEAAVRLNPFRDISDPVAWQREIRQDRPLPGRDD
ncbi:MAG: DUF2281 domain-containing protein [Magnetococcales bacterium]|nr:DUF2281 domain-containing protein [Magnetococcales bacterium]